MCDLFTVFIVENAHPQLSLFHWAVDDFHTHPFFAWQALNLTFHFFLALTASMLNVATSVRKIRLEVM